MKTKMNDDLYISLKQIAFAFIQADKSTGKEIKFENINSYVDRATSLFPMMCDENIKKKIICRYRVSV